jgi:hypothetical protein
MYIEVHDYVQIIVYNIKIFIEMLHKNTHTFIKNTVMECNFLWILNQEILYFPYKKQWRSDLDNFHIHTVHQILPKFFIH